MRRDEWRGIELRHLAALDAISRERSFRGAATRLGYVQSAISRQIACLERMTGARLIERSQGPGPVRLTEAGELLLEHAHDILASVEAAKLDIDSMRGTREDVRLGIFPGVPNRILPPALAAFREHHPDLRVAVTESSCDTPLLEYLLNGRLDLAFVCLPLESEQIETCALLSEPWVLVVRVDDELAARSAPPMAADLAGVPLVGIKAARLPRLIERHLRSDAGAPNVLCLVDLAQTAQALAAGGIGAAIAPRGAIEEHDPRTRVVELNDLLPPLRVGLAWHRHRRLTGAVEELRDLMQSVCGPRVS